MCCIYTFVLLDFLPCASITLKNINSKCLLINQTFDIFPQTRALKKCFLLWQTSFHCGRKGQRNCSEVKSFAGATSPDLSDASTWPSTTVLYSLSVVSPSGKPTPSCRGNAPWLPALGLPLQSTCPNVLATTSSLVFFTRLPSSIRTLGWQVGLSHCCISKAC